MTREEAIETLKANYPDACYEQLREAVDAAIEVLKAQDAPDTNVGNNGDTIYRQAAIDIVDFECGEWRGLAKTIEQAIERLPSAQPDAIHLEWIAKHLEWLDNCDNEFAQLAKVGIREMVEIWKKEKTQSADRRRLMQSCT